jgi:hypothetical protein
MTQDIFFVNFLEMNLGRWITQRTIYLIKENSIQIHKSEIVVQKKTNIGTAEEYFSYLSKPIEFDELSQKKIKVFHPNNIISLLKYMNAFNHLSINNTFGDLNSIEKLWLVNPNLRLGISIIKKYDKCVGISFSSDIKLN